MKELTAVLIVAGLVGCGDSEAPEQGTSEVQAGTRAPELQQTPEQAMAKVRRGTSEAELRQILTRHAIESGTVYWGGSGAKRIYFQISTKKQGWFEIGGSFDKELFGRVTEIGGVEPKTKWTRYEGDSITVDGGPAKPSKAVPKSAPSASP